MYTHTHSPAAFPKAVFYRALLAPAVGCVRESAPGSPFPWSERHLRCLWYDPRYRPADLETVDGQSVTVLDPGRWNLEAGPDFMDATLVVHPGARHLQGDVELHVRPADWDQHGHRADPRYRRLIAHVTWSNGQLPTDVLPAGALQIALQPYFRASRAFSFDTLDVTAYPYATRGDEPPCRQPWRALLPDGQAVVLEAAGQERLRRKAERLATDSETKGQGQVLYEEALAALGYKHNRQPCRELAARLPAALLRETSGGDAMHAYALLCGVAGLLPAQATPGWDGAARAFVRSLWDTWWKHSAAWSGRTLAKQDWTLANCRPPNQPLRRLMAAAEWFGGPELLAERLLALSAGPPSDFLPAVLALLVGTGRQSFWATRQGLSGQCLSKRLAIVGPDRAASLLVNVIVPWLAAGGHTELTATLMASLPPEDDNQVARHTAHALFGHDHNPGLYRRSGLRQQGLLQIFHDFCLDARGGCEHCPFPGALARAGVSEQ